MDDTLWSAPPVTALAGAGVLNGYPDGTFRPGASISRAEFAVCLSRFYSYADPGPCRFPDLEGHWAAASVEFCAARGWVRGLPDGGFHPEAPISRMEAVVILNRVLGLDPQADGCTWPDVDPAAWYYADLCTAAGG